MNIAEEMWTKLASKRYREEFALSVLKRSVAFQIKTLRKKHCGSQAILAERAKLTQGVVSRAEDQDYGNLTFNTVGRIAGGLDMAFVGKFVSFSDLVRYFDELSERRLASIPTFEEEAEPPSFESRKRHKKIPSDERGLGTALRVMTGGQSNPRSSAVNSPRLPSKQLELDLLPGNVRRMPQREARPSSMDAIRPTEKQRRELWSCSM